MVIRRKRPYYYDESHRYAVFIYPPDDEDGTPTLNPQSLLEGRFWSPHGFYTYQGISIPDWRSIARKLVEESHRIGKFINGEPETYQMLLKIFDNYADENRIP